MNRLLTVVSISLLLFSLVALFFYSFTQIDLGLSLSRFATWHQIQRVFQQVGYFDRPLSAQLYVMIVLFLSASYLFLLFLLHKKILTTKSVLLLSLVASGILFLSYNAFSYDVFNYIFDAKIITEYGDNPYERKALDYPNDPMLGFMRWTHRVYPYGPIWLAISVPLSLLGMGSLLLNMILFKGIAVLSYIGSVYFLRKTIEKVGTLNVGFHTGLFALNPLVLIESLVSGHNDIVMIFLIILAFYLMVSQKHWMSIILFGLSVGVKFATVFLLPVFVYLVIKRGNVSHWQKTVTYSFILMSLAVLAAVYRSAFQLQPWYLLYILPFMALSKKESIIVPSIVLSLLTLFQYLPYIYVGNYNPPIPLLMTIMVSSSLVIASLVLVFVFIFQKIKG